MMEADAIRNGVAVMCPNCNGINAEDARACWNCDDPMEGSA